jgi:hypothetical protein
LALVRRELSRPAEPHALGLRTGTAVTCTGDDQLALELREAAEDREHQPAMRCLPLSDKSEAPPPPPLCLYNNPPLRIVFVVPVER